MSFGSVVSFSATAEATFRWPVVSIGLTVTEAFLRIL